MAWTEPHTWDVLAAEVVDTRAAARRQIRKRACLICRTPTQALSGICSRHPIAEGTNLEPDQLEQARPERVTQATRTGEPASLRDPLLPGTTA